jgi:hypothetical protein
MVGKVIDADMQGVLLAEDDLGEGVPDEDYINSSSIHDAGKRSVVGGDHDDRVAAPAAF